MCVVMVHSMPMNVCPTCCIATVCIHSSLDTFETEHGIHVMNTTTITKKTFQLQLVDEPHWYIVIEHHHQN